MKKEYTIKEFIQLYMNDHDGGTPRWLRSVFYNEQEKIETILEYMNAMEAKLSQAAKEAVEVIRKEISELGEHEGYATSHSYKKAIQEALSLPSLKLHPHPIPPNADRTGDKGLIK